MTDPDRDRIREHGEKVARARKHLANRRYFVPHLVSPPTRMFAVLVYIEGMGRPRQYGVDALPVVGIGGALDSAREEGDPIAGDEKGHEIYVLAAPPYDPEAGDSVCPLGGLVAYEEAEWGPVFVGHRVIACWGDPADDRDKLMAYAKDIAEDSRDGGRRRRSFRIGGFAEIDPSSGPDD